VLGAAGLGAFLAVTRSLEEQFDSNLTDRVQGFASIVFQQEDEVDFEFSDELMPEYADEERPAYFELWYVEGELLERSNSLGGEDLDIEGTLEVPVEPTLEPQHWTAPLPDGRDGRYVAQIVEVHHVYPEEGPERPQARKLLIVVARGREEFLAAERTVLIQCLAASLVLIGLIAFLSWYAVEKGLEPAKRLASTLDAIHVDHLPAGLDVGPLPHELEPVRDKTDALIRRVDRALERERRTTADIAHELRTPISELLTVSEVALRNGKDPEKTRTALRTTRDVASRMGRSVSTLLKLARLEMGTESFEHEEVDLGGLVNDVLRPLKPLERERRILVGNDIAPRDVVIGDDDVLRIVVSNLLSNALTYSPEGGRVDCRLEGQGSDWSLTVENEAGDLENRDMRTLTEPFWRKDHARVDRNRSGLGLALSAALAERTGMRLSFELERGTFRAVLTSN